MGRDLIHSLCCPISQNDFNPLSPHGERPSWVCSYRFSQSISIHSPRMGRDHSALSLISSRLSFQSTLPAWGETVSLKSGKTLMYDFNPLSPHGERLYTNLCAAVALLTFQSTLPAWGETGLYWTCGRRFKISIHSPRMGRDALR